MKRIIIALLVVVVLTLAIGAPVLAGHINRSQGHGGGNSDEPTGETDISIEKNKFVSDNVEISGGGGTVEIIWTNIDVKVHEVEVFNLDGTKVSNSPDMVPDTTSAVWSLPLSTGEYNIRCEYHPGMKGTVNITD